MRNSPPREARLTRRSLESNVKSKPRLAPAASNDSASTTSNSSAKGRGSVSSRLARANAHSARSRLAFLFWPFWPFCWSNGLGLHHVAQADAFGEFRFITFVRCFESDLHLILSDFNKGRGFVSAR